MSMACGSGGSDMNGLLFESSSLISGDMLAVGYSDYSDTATSNSGIYLDDSLLVAKTIKAHGYGGDVTEK